MSKTHEPRNAPLPGSGTQDLLIVQGDLPRLAWVIGARLTACQFTGSGIIVQRDPALEATLAAMGADLAPLNAVFSPDTDTTAPDAKHRLGRRHVQFHVARMHADDGAEDDASDAESGPPAANA
ncbi:MAG: hypothetical protein CVT82_09085 [Alphaproteobacteria bacterium HGW-Alphaproteobacteria-4]|jgi:urease accessory protein|nr:MAG: hypothetical protein CVT82_09085 [Alphaproteobacteria bacterium HGW-Alphaproteobacteria-4]